MSGNFSYVGFQAAVEYLAHPVSLQSLYVVHSIGENVENAYALRKHEVEGQ